MSEITLHLASMLDWLAAYDGPLFDACVTDPPYHLTTGKKGGTGDASASDKTPHGRARITAGFMGKAWDGGDIAFQPETWRRVFDALKPGAHLVAFSGTRTYHRMACAIEDAGFEIRDQLAWTYGSGFPKSLDVSKAIDKAAGAKRQTIGPGKWAGRESASDLGLVNDDSWQGGADRLETAPATPEAQQWQGWGTALKPAWEPICLARKPLGERNVAANVLAHGTGAINVDGCRVGTTKRVPGGISKQKPGAAVYGKYGIETGAEPGHDPNIGRFPANLIHDGSDEVLAGLRNDDGSAARFFYSAKAGPLDRIGTAHATVKPVDLMRWLCRLITPPGGRILEPFAGSGTTGIAAMIEGFDCTMIELIAEHATDIERKLAYLRGEGGASVIEQHRARINRDKAKGAADDHGPLFG